MSDTSDGESATIPRDDFADIKSSAKGNISLVLSAYHPSLGRVILKHPRHDSRAPSETERENLLEEIARLASIRHDHVARFFGCISDRDGIALVMEQVQLGSLSELVRGLFKERITWPTSIACRVIHHVALGMQHLHGLGIIHLNLNSFNVLMTGDFVAKITNFGLTKWWEYAERAQAAEERETTASLPSPTPTIVEDAQTEESRVAAWRRAAAAHAPPESLKQPELALPRKEHDVYSFAIFTWEVLSAREPYEGCTDDEIRDKAAAGERPELKPLPPDRPEGVVLLLRSCWHERPEKRPDFTEIAKLTKVILYDFKICISQDDLALREAMSDMQMRKTDQVSMRSDQASLPMHRAIREVADMSSNQGSLMPTSLQARDESDMTPEELAESAHGGADDEDILLAGAEVGCLDSDAEERQSRALTEAAVRLLAPTMLPVWECGLVQPSQPSLPRDLSVAAMLAIERLWETYGDFTYYQLADMQIVLHGAARMSMEDLGHLKQEFLRVARQHIRPFELVVTDAPFDAVLLGNGIGSTVFVDGHPQTIGMYVVYGQGQIFFLTTAHGFVTSGPGQPANRPPSIAVTAGPEQAGNYSNLVQIAEPRACCSCVPFVDEHQVLLHYVDVMACPMPVLAAEIDGGAVIPTGGLRVVQDPNGPAYSVDDIAFFKEEEEFSQTNGTISFVVLDTKDLLTKQVSCFPRQKDISVKGKIVACRAAVVLGSDRERSVVMNNVLLIQPLGRGVPALGDCGSIWVLQGSSSSSRAVAITVGRGKLQDGAAVWLAAPLHACLQALCKHHPSVFQNPKLFRPL